MSTGAHRGVRALGVELCAPRRARQVRTHVLVCVLSGAARGRRASGRARKHLISRPPAAAAEDRCSLVSLSPRIVSLRIILEPSAAGPPTHTHMHTHMRMRTCRETEKSRAERAGGAGRKRNGGGKVSARVSVVARALADMQLARAQRLPGLELSPMNA